MFCSRPLLTAAITESKKLATLLVHGPDYKGIVAACSSLLNRHGCAISASEQWTDTGYNLFFQRIQFDQSAVLSMKTTIEEDMHSELRDRFPDLQIRFNWYERPKRVAIMVSKYDHCLWEILLRHRAKELDCEIPIIISNHTQLESTVKGFDIPFEVFPITRENKLKQEEKELDMLKNQYNIDTVVLARYMQGGRPYQRAHERGVKLIGATAHYATLDLDEGPIIEQAVIQVSHRDEPNDLLCKGRIIERNVLVNALQAHLDDRIIVYKNKCVVFGD